MDAIVFLLAAFIILVMKQKDPSFGTNETVQTNMENKKALNDASRVTRLNEMYYEDQDAFMEIAHQLGFPK